MINHRIKKADKGFTIVEVLTTLFLIAVIVVVSSQLLITSTQASSRAQRYIIADSVAFAKIQEYENLAFEDIPIGNAASSFLVEDFSSDIASSTGQEINDASGFVFIEGFSGSLLRVEVQLIFPGTAVGNDQLIEYATFIQIGGVGR